MKLHPLILAAVLAAPAMTRAGDDKAPDAEAAPAKAEDNVRITLQTSPSRKAIVRWGKKSLGVIPAPRPLIVVRPRDSGPLDLVIRLAGYLPVHTRAYTFSDSRVAVKLTPLADKNKLFGYREELPPEEETAPEQDPSTPTPAPAPAQPTPAPPPPPTTTAP